jgi:hypothetical protein
LVSAVGQGDGPVITCCVPSLLVLVLPLHFLFFLSLSESRKYVHFLSRSTSRALSS